MNKNTYVCNDRSIKIEAEDLPGMRRIVITLSVNEKPAWKIPFPNSLSSVDNVSERLDRYTAQACKKVVSMSKWQVENYADADKVMASLYVWRHLKEVRAKLGNVIWAKS